MWVSESKRVLVVYLGNFEDINSNVPLAWTSAEEGMDALTDVSWRGVGIPSAGRRWIPIRLFVYGEIAAFKIWNSRRRAGI